MSRAHVLSVDRRRLRLPRTASAHHGIANFDLNKDISISGTVAKLAFVNPHSWLYVNVVGADGKADRMAVRDARRDGAAPLGLERGDVHAGHASHVTGSPDRNEPNTCYLGTITFADGTSMDRYGQRQKAGRRPWPPIGPSACRTAIRI